MMLPDESGNGIDFYYDSEKVLDILDSLGLCIRISVLKSIDSHDKDSVVFFRVRDSYYLVIKASDPEDPGIALGVAQSILRLIDFIKNSPDELLDEESRKLLITELLEIHNNDGKGKEIEGEVRSWVV